MKLNEIADKLEAWMEEHDYEEEFDEFDALCDEIMSDNQTYFQWDVDNDTFEIDEAFDSVLRFILQLQEDGKQMVSCCSRYIDTDHLFVFIEYK